MLSYETLAAIHLSAFLVCAVLVASCLLRLYDPGAQKERLRLTIVIALLEAVVTLEYVMLACGGSPMILPTVWVIQYGIAFASVYYFHRYMIAYARLRNGSRYARWVDYLPIPFCIAAFVLYAASAFTGYFYTFDAYGNIIDNENFWMPQLFLAVVLIVDAALVARKVGKVRNYAIAVFLFYISCPIIGIVLYCLTGIKVTSAIAAIALLALHCTVDVETTMEIKEQQLLLASQEVELADRNARIMLSQIQPHFLFNSISSIMLLCMKDPEAAVEALADFSDYLRGDLDSLSQRDPVPFAKELSHIKTYMRLELLRFPGKLHVEYDIQVENFLLPALSVQPLMENAVKHGVGKKQEGGTVVLRTEETEDEVRVVVSDDGVGFDPASKPDDGRSHLGMENVRCRLKTMCGGELHVQSVLGEGTRATIVIPKQTPKG